jgi:hypothetical protein
MTNVVSPPEPQRSQRDRRPGLNTRRVWLSLAIAAIVVVVLASQSGGFDAWQQCVNKYARSDASQANQKGRALLRLTVAANTNCIWWFIDRNDKPIVALGTICIFFATGWLALNTYRLWNVTADMVRQADDTARENARKLDQSTREATRAADAAARSAKVAEDALHLTQRARIHVDSWEIRNLAANSETVRIIYRFSNTGPTDGRIVSTEFACSVNEPWEAIPAYSPESPAVGMVPGNSALGGFFVVNEPMSDGTVQRLLAGTGSIKVWGRIKYSDVFEHSHDTGFAAELTWVNGKMEDRLNAPPAYYFAT